MFDVAVLQHEAGIALGVTAINEPLHVGEEPVNGNGSWGEREEGGREGRRGRGGGGRGGGRGGGDGEGKGTRGERKGVGVEKRGWEGREERE